MLQGAITSLVVAVVAGLLGFTGLAGPEAKEAARLFLFIGVGFLAAFITLARLRRWHR